MVRWLGSRLFFQKAILVGKITGVRGLFLENKMGWKGKLNRTKQIKPMKKNELGDKKWIEMFRCEILFYYGKDLIILTPSNHILLKILNN